MRISLILTISVFHAAAYGTASKDSEDYLPIMDNTIKPITVYSHRDIRLWRAGLSKKNGTEHANKPYFFMEPLFLFSISKGERYPWKASKFNNKPILAFQIVLHNKDQEKIAESHLLSLLRNDGTSLTDVNNIQIWKWPTKKVNLVFSDVRDIGSPILIVENKAIGSKDQANTITIHSESVSTDTIDKLGFLFDNQLLHVSVSIQYRGVTEETASIAATFSAAQRQELQKEINTIVERTKADGKQYIFADDARKIADSINYHTRIAIGYSDDSLASKLPNIGTSFIDKLPKGYKPLDFDSKNDPLTKAFSEYLKPLVSTSESGKEDEKTNTQKIVLGKIPQVEFENKHRVKLTKKDTDNFYTPTEVEVAIVTDLNSRINDDLFVRIARSAGTLNEYVNLDNFLVHKATSNYQPKNYNDPVVYDIPVGTVLCSLSKASEPPIGFEWVNANTNWPNQSWIPKYAQAGNPMPETVGAVFVGTTQEGLGKLFSGTQLTEEYRVSNPTFYHPGSYNSVPLKAYTLTIGVGRLMGDESDTYVSDIRPIKDLPEYLVSLGNKELARLKQGPVAQLGLAKQQDQVYVPTWVSPFTNGQFYPPSIGCRYMIRMDVD